MSNKLPVYEQIEPIAELSDLIDSFWIHRSQYKTNTVIPIIPDSFFKIILFVQEGKIIDYFMTGFFNHKMNFELPAKVVVYGCRLKILAPQFLLNQEVASILQGVKKLDLTFLNVINFDLLDARKTITQWQKELLAIKTDEEIPKHKLNLSRLLDKSKGEINAKEVSETIFWSNRQINRYLNQYIGMSLKKYLNIQKVYQSYIPIKKGNLYPDKNFYDQSHFIREVKKHTGETPKRLHQEQNDRFIQLRDIKDK